MINYASEKDGENIPEKGDGNFRKALVYLLSRARKVGEGLRIIRTGNKLEGLDKIVIIDEDERKRIESQPTLVIDENGDAVKNDTGSKIEDVFDDGDWREIEMRGKSRRLKGAEYTPGNSPEQTLHERIKEYDNNEFFSDSLNSDDAVYIADGPQLKEAFRYLLIGDYGKMRGINTGIKQRHYAKNTLIPEELQYILNELESLAKIRLQEQETRKLKQIPEKIAAESQETKSRRYRDENGVLHVSSEITEDERKLLEIKYRKERKLRESLFNPDKK